MTDNEKFAPLPWRAEGEAREKYIENLAPVVIFTYNRPEHTKKTIEALKRNVLAENTEVYIFSDGPKNEAAKDKVEEVREYLRSLSGFKAVHLTEREENVGLAENIIYGITKLTDEYGKVIVIEDDIVTTKYFLQYMNDALEIYKDEEQVMAISGFCSATDKEGLPDTYFLPWFSCWGWATWKRSWDYFERNPQKALTETSDKVRYRLNMDGTWDVWEQVVNNANGNIYTWAVFFVLAIMNRNRLVLYPQYDLCKNIGADGSGEHGSSTIYERGELPDIEVTNFTLDIEESKIGVERQKAFNIKTMENVRFSWMARLWLDTNSVNFWHNELALKLVYALSRDSSWLVMGDGRNSMDSAVLRWRGFKKAIPADTFQNRLQPASEKGVIADYLVLSTDKLEIPSERYDYVFCRDIYKLTNQPYALIYEFLRVAKKGVVLSGPLEQDSRGNLSVNYEPGGNFVFRLSVSELAKISMSMNLPALCWNSFADVSIQGAEYEPANEEKSAAFKKITQEFAKINESVQRGESKHKTGTVILFKAPPENVEVENLKKLGAIYQELPKNPYKH